MFKHKADPEVQTQIDTLRRDLIAVAEMLKEYEEVNTKAVRGIADGLAKIGRAVDVIGQQVMRLSGGGEPGAGGDPENRWKQ